jgi:signal transduction histidine kinase
MGLASMKERTLLSGGSFDIRSSPESGTIIHATWSIGKAGYTEE